MRRSQFKGQEVDFPVGNCFTTPGKKMVSHRYREGARPNFELRSCFLKGTQAQPPACESLAKSFMERILLPGTRRTVPPLPNLGIAGLQAEISHGPRNTLGNEGSSCFEPGGEAVLRNLFPDLGKVQKEFVGNRRVQVGQFQPSRKKKGAFFPR